MYQAKRARDQQLNEMKKEVEKRKEVHDRSDKRVGHGGGRDCFLSLFNQYLLMKIAQVLYMYMYIIHKHIR